MTHYKLAFLGFGNVGRALAELLLRKRAELRDERGITFSVTGIATARHGMVANPNGLDLTGALDLLRTGRPLTLLTNSLVSDSLDFIRKCGADVLFENTPVNYENGQPAIDHVRLALENGMHVATANKGTIVHAYRELRDLAAARGRKFYFESTVMDGAPIFSLFREALPGATLKGFRGVLNSTTNLILTRMEDGDSFDEAVRYAQEIGIAETDPSGDIDGWDAAIKISALATVLMDSPLRPQDVRRQGIRAITPQMVAEAKAQGKRYKLVCAARRIGERLEASLAPELVPVTSPFYGLEGTSSVIEFQTDVLGDLTVLEANPGPQTTAYGLLADWLNIAKL
ncbi:MAG: homoserine dehydrogenase [Anaerolineae bacterium CG_4_9_14_3_um_filter_57_17]|nr:homoserine dehydrogenase [bacterium]NCT21619.1 homoserine dehydrogenase [bacterium]OIO85765.1 MAG: homoserine dehydrogenase [Anaerolineae bacterium CG2_30_57_67]PJB66658.1 MAG: homoserine dehydrogenase [Anaerolineae bacterium CG_4_9_14_3_um_filter_57_17]